MATGGALAGWNILIPRGGKWGNSAAARALSLGATPVIAPLIDFTAPEDAAALNDAIGRLSLGEFDWLVVTSATTVPSLAGVNIPDTTKIAAVGQATSDALADAGLRVDLMPHSDFSAAALVDAFRSDSVAAAGLRIFLPQSAIADTALAEGLRDAGCQVHAVTAYRTVSVAAPPDVIAAVRSEERWAILVTSGSVAREVALQFAPFPSKGATPALVCIGARTAKQAAALGLPIAAVATQQSVTSMFESLIHFAKEHS